MDNATETYQHYSEYRAGLLIWKSVPPFLIAFGTVGNCLSVIVLTRRSIRKSTTALFLTCLTVADLLVLYTGILRQWLINLLEFDIRHVSEIMCKFHTWIVYSSLDFSVWMLIALTLKRIIAVWSQMQYSSRTICNRRNATVLIILVLAFLLELNSHIIYGVGNKVKRKITGNFLKRDYKMKSLFLFKLCCLGGGGGGKIWPKNIVQNLQFQLRDLITIKTWV